MAGGLHRAALLLSLDDRQSAMNVMKKHIDTWTTSARLMVCNLQCCPPRSQAGWQWRPTAAAAAATEPALQAISGQPHPCPAHHLLTDMRTASKRVSASQRHADIKAVWPTAPGPPHDSWVMARFDTVLDAYITVHGAIMDGSIPYWGDSQTFAVYSLSSGKEDMLLHAGSATASLCSTDTPTRRARAMLMGRCKI